MIHAYFEQQGDLLVGCSVKGHASNRSGKQQESILCAAVSSAMQLTANTLTEILHAEVELMAHPSERDSQNHLAFRLKQPDAVQSDLLRGLLLHFTILREDFNGGIAVEVRTVTE